MTAISRRVGEERESDHIRELDWLMLVVMALCCLGMVMAVSVRGSQISAGAMLVMKTQGLKQLFGMEKSAFYGMKLWKQRDLKKRVGLF